MIYWKVDWNHHVLNKEKVIIIALSVILFSLVQYVIYEKIIQSRQQELANAYQNGYNKGVTDAAISIYKQTNNCQTTTISIGNLSKNIFDLSCLKIQLRNATR